MWILIGSGAFLLIGGGITAWLLLRNPSGSGGSDSSGSGGPKGGRIADVSKASLDKLEDGMTLDEVKDILGPGKEATREDMDMAFGNIIGAGQSPAEQWERNAKNNQGKTTWYQWRSGDNSIFVGFVTGKKSGTEIALLSFFVHRLGNNGFESSSNMMARGVADPDVIAKARSDRIKMLNDPKWKEGKPRELLLGKWQTSPQDSYTFGADGKVQVNSFGGNYESTYKFTDDDHIQITIPANKGFPPNPQPLTMSYRVLVSKDELKLLSIPKNFVMLQYKRAK